MSEYTGKDVSYYLVTIAKPKRLDPYTAECEDIIEALGMSFAEGCAFKAIWRKCAARTLGITKAGYKGGLYDAEKTQYYGARMVAAEERAGGTPKHPDDIYDIYSASPDTADAIKSDTVRMAFAARPNVHTMTNPPGEDIYAEFAARVGTAPGYELLIKCEECRTVSRGGRLHVATCSQLTAPEEYKAEAQVAFDEAARVSDALARQVSAGFIEDPAYSHCPHCGSPEGCLHNPDCTTMRRGKSILGQTIAEIQAERAAQASAGQIPDIACSHCPGCGSPQDTPHKTDCHLLHRSDSRLLDDMLSTLPAGFDWDSAASEEEEVLEAEEEPAAAMDDDSPRMQAIGQNGNDGEHYDDPFAGAPEWAKYKAQDGDGCWYWYEGDVYPSGSQWVELASCGRLDQAGGGEPNPNWRDTLITRT